MFWMKHQKIASLWFFAACQRVASQKSKIVTGDENAKKNMF